jgi:hypothetical protein
VLADDRDRRPSTPRPSRRHLERTSRRWSCETALASNRAELACSPGGSPSSAKNSECPRADRRRPFPSLTTRAPCGSVVRISPAPPTSPPPARCPRKPARACSIACWATFLVADLAEAGSH